MMNPLYYKQTDILPKDLISSNLEKEELQLRQVDG